MAATRYDPNAYLLIEIDTKRDTWRLINADFAEWSMHFSKPYRGNDTALKLHLFGG
jgi:hypothetical protein